MIIEFLNEVEEELIESVFWYEAKEGVKVNDFAKTF